MGGAFLKIKLTTKINIKKNQPKIKGSLFWYRWGFLRLKLSIFERSRGILRWFLKMLVRLFCFKPPFLSIGANFLWSKDSFWSRRLFRYHFFTKDQKEQEFFRWLLTFIKIRWLFSIDIGAHFLLKIKGFIFYFRGIAF